MGHTAGFCIQAFRTRLWERREPVSTTSPGAASSIWFQRAERASSTYSSRKYFDTTHRSFLGMMRTSEHWKCVTPWFGRLAGRRNGCVGRATIWSKNVVRGPGTERGVACGDSAPWVHGSRSGWSARTGIMLVQDQAPYWRNFGQSVCIPPANRDFWHIEFWFECTKNQLCRTIIWSNSRIWRTRWQLCILTTSMKHALKCRQQYIRKDIILKPSHSLFNINIWHIGSAMKCMYGNHICAHAIQVLTQYQWNVTIAHWNKQQQKSLIAVNFPIT